MVKMKLRQKPPTESGFYWALPKDCDDCDELTFVRVRFEKGYTYIDCLLDAGCECADYNSLKDFKLWYGPVEPPKIRIPKRWINYFQEPKPKPLPQSCRRWGHKWVEDEPP